MRHIRYIDTFVVSCGKNPLKVTQSNMPPKRGSRIGGASTGKAPKLKTRTQVTRRQTGQTTQPRNRRSNTMVSPRTRGTSRRHQFTDAQMAEAFSGLDLRTTPAAKATEAIRGLDMPPQPVPTTVSTGQAGN